MVVRTHDSVSTVALYHKSWKLIQDTEEEPCSQMVLGLAHSFRSNISSYSRSFNSLLFFFDCSSKRGDGIFGGRGRERETKKRRRWTEVVKEYRCAKSRPRSFAVGALSFSDRAQGRVKGAPGPTRNQALSFSLAPPFLPLVEFLE